MSSLTVTGLFPAGFINLHGIILMFLLLSGQVLWGFQEWEKVLKLTERFCGHELTNMGLQVDTITQQMAVKGDSNNE